jgi:hypothetical protein
MYIVYFIFTFQKICRNHVCPQIVTIRNVPYMALYKYLCLSFLIWNPRWLIIELAAMLKIQIKWKSYKMLRKTELWKANECTWCKQSVYNTWHGHKHAFILKFNFQCRRFTYFSIWNPGRFSISEQEVNHTQKFIQV